jgi:hypothetical protein
VELDRFAPHRLVPHGHDVEGVVDEPLVGEVVPAIDAQPRADAEAARAAQELHLRRPWLDERRHEDEIRSVPLDELVDVGMPRHGAVAGVQHRGEQPSSHGGVDERPAHHRRYEVGYAAFRAEPQLGGVGVLGAQVAQVVAPAPELLAEKRPRPERQRRCDHMADRRVSCA